MKKRAPTKALAADKAKKAAEQDASADTLTAKLNGRLAELEQQRRHLKDQNEQAKAVADQTGRQLDVVAGAVNEVRVLMQDLGVEPGEPDGEGEGDELPEEPVEGE